VALSNRGVFEVRPGGSANNSGYFDGTVSVPGVDYSQQNAAQVSRVDLVIGAANTVSSALLPFDPSEAGNGLHILSGTGFTASTTPYLIQSVAGGVATLDRSPGTLASTGGHGNMGGALSGPADLPALVPGQIVWMKGAFTTTATITLTAGSGDGTFCVYRGYGTVRGDGGRASITTGSVLAPILALANQIIVQNLLLDGTNIAQRAVDVGSLCDFENVEAVRCLFNGFKAQNSGTKLHRCMATACGDGFDVGTGSVASECEAFLCNNGFRSSNATPEFIDCLSHSNVSHGLFVQGANGPRVRNCVFDGNTLDGIRIADTSGIMAMQVTNCALTNNLGYGIRSVTTDYSLPVSAPLGAFFRNNAFFGNALGNYFQAPAGAADILLTATPYTNAAGGDYSLNGTAGGGPLLLGAGLPGGFGLEGSGASASVGRRDVGAVQSLGQGVASTATQTMRSLWREATNERFTAGDAASAVPDATVDIYLDYGLQALNREAHYHISDGTIALIAGQQEYALPADFVLANWLQYGGYRKLERSDVERWMSRGEDWRNDPAGEPKAWALYSNKLIIRPAPSGEAVAAAANLTLRYVSTPPSITTNGPEQLGSQEYRLVVMYGALLWSILFPESLVAQQRIAEVQKLWDASVPKVVQEYAARSIST
jgi:parallel beta-helix repeat protein